jgi:hypothetical protein
VKPDTGQANFSENTMRLGGRPRALHRPASILDFAAPARRRSAEVDVRQPLGQLERLLEAVGEPRLDARRFTASRSTTTSMSCLYFLSSAGRVLDLDHLAVDPHRG